MSNREPANQGQPDDDQWAEIVAAAGYDESAGAPIYTGRKDEGPSATDRWLSGDLLSDEAGPGARRPADPVEALSDPLAAPAAAPSWDQPDRWADEDDVVLRAFEAHARAEPAAPGAAAPAPFQPQEPADIDELLGDDADDLVEEAMAAVVEGSAARRDPFSEPRPWEDPPPRTPAGNTYASDDEGWDRPEPAPDEDGDGNYLDHPERFGAPAAAAAAAEASAAPVEATVMRSRKRQGRTVAREVVETLLLALLVFLAVRASFQNFKVDGNSMYPTLENGEFLIVNKLLYSEVDVEKLSRFLPFLEPGESPRRFVFHGPERGDIIVLHDPRTPDTDLIKRVIGLPGETIEIIEGTIFINGFMLEEPYIQQAWHYTGPATVLGPNEYFVMGDNRDNSKDSRTIGPILRDSIIGKAMLTYWPAGDFGRAPNGSPEVTDETVEAFRAERGLPTVATSP